MAYIHRRETKDGRVRYRVQIRMKGFPIVSETFQRKTDARKWAEDTESGMRAGRYFETAEAQKHSVKEAIDRYMATVMPSKKAGTRYSQERQLAWWRQRIGEHLLSEVNAALVTACKEELLAGETHLGGKRAPATVVRYLAVLSHVFTVARKDWGWVRENPLADVSRPKEARGRVRWLDDSERQALLKACKDSPNPMLYAVTILALSTGARQGEIMSLEWRDVDFERGRLVFEDTKNGERRGVPLVSHAQATLREYERTRRRVGTDLVFPGKNPQKPVDLRTPWLSALKKSGVQDFRFHDLRHSAASYLAMNGATLAEIAEVLGHKTLSMVRRYAHLSEGHVSGVVQRMNEKIFADSGKREEA